jgi:aminoglycoside phosphotransferase family enzyme/predicted kinase
MEDEPEALAGSRMQVEGLRAALEACGDGPVRLVQTHISWVLLTPAHAFKLKKPVRLPFLDFTSPAARRRDSEEELRLNRRLAPSLYLDLVDVCAGPAGWSFGGPGPVVDVALRMRRFADGALWTERLADGSLGPEDIDALAQRLADFHAGAAIASVDDRHGTAERQSQVTCGLIAAIDALATEPGAGPLPIDWSRLRTWLQTEAGQLAPHWDQRVRAGRVRECHGDLHLANVVQLDDGPTAFDALEFDAELRWIDVLDDIAFLAMDLIAHRAPALAHRLLDRWLEATGDFEGVAALRFYLVRRALVRCHVAALRRRQGADGTPTCDAVDYLRVAEALSRSANPRLAITHGLPGSGKTHLSGRLVEAAGAIRARSDVERKRLFGLRALESSAERIAGGIYDRAATARTYARLLEIARLGLAAGWPVIVDAAFLQRAERAAFEALAASLHAPWTVLECLAPLAVLHRRLDERRAAGADASEADGAVLERLVQVDEPIDAAERARAIVVSADGPLDVEAVVRQWLAACEGSGRSPVAGDPALRRAADGFGLPVPDVS